MNGERRRVALIARAALFGACVISSACTWQSTKPHVAKAQIAASSDVNPNKEGRPSPLHVRVFQLKEPGAFATADYWSLVDAEQETLGASLVQRLELDIDPGERKTFEMQIAPEANVLGVMAEFADYRNARWRVVTQRPNKSLLDILKKDRITIELHRDQAVIAVGD